jgi:hypothetical protein
VIKRAQPKFTGVAKIAAERAHEARPMSRPAPSDGAVRQADTVYFVASHTNPPQVVRLANACLSGGNPRSRVLIHHNYDVSRLEPSSLHPLGNVDILPQHRGMNRESFASCEMLLKAIDWALENLKFDWFVNLSGQDYPIKPLAEMEQFLAATPYDGFVLAKPVEKCQWHTGIGRYYYRYFDLPKVRGVGRLRRHLRDRQRRELERGNAYPRFAIPGNLHGPRKIGIRPHRLPFGDDFRCYFGSAWWTLSRRTLESMSRTIRQRPDLVRHYHRSLWAPTESFFATLALNDPSLNICTATDKRFISWSDPASGRPDVLTVADWDRLMASDAFFARKIDGSTDTTLLDRLDQHIGVTPPLSTD